MKRVFIGFVLSVFIVVSLSACKVEESSPKSDSGISKVTAKVKAGSDGMTTEQRNVKNRLEEDNKPGSIKHLYLISAYSGQVIFYSTVAGKVTSSGKRLTPTEITDDQYSGDNPLRFTLGNVEHHTKEVLQDDGTYGSSVEYLYWWDTKGIYHQHYISGGQIVHVSSQPIAVKSVIINLDTVK